MINAIIIDDEEHCLERLGRLLAVHCAGKVRLLGSYTTVEQGELAINTHKPELIFLDVQLHDKTGFDLLKRIDVTNICIIFTTAFEEYAITAFKFSALDYLLKPVAKDELISSVDKAINSIALAETAARYETLFHNLKTDAGTSKKLCLPATHGFEFVVIDDIIRCQSSGNYTIFFLKNGEKITIARTLKEFETLLDGHHFFRVHYSHLVNLAYVKRYHKGNGGYIVLTDNAEIEVSTRRKDAFLMKMSLRAER